jgi:sortase A
VVAHSLPGADVAGPRPHLPVAGTAEPPPGGSPGAPAAAGWPGLAGVDLRALLGMSCSIFGLLVLCFLVYLFSISNVVERRSQGALLRQLRKEVAEHTAPAGGGIEPGRPVALLQIPRLDLRQVVVEGTDPSQLKKGPGHLRSSPLGGQVGNVVIFGRRSTFGAPFRQLPRLEPGDRIVLTAGQGRSLYQVDRVRRVAVGGADVIDDQGDDRLTLVTSDPPLLPTRRLAVSAYLVAGEFDAPPGSPGRPAQIGLDEEGLRGDGLAVVPVLCWSLLLLVAAVATTLLYQRWAPVPTWLLTTPVLLALLFLLVDSFAGLLPATL